MYGLGIERPHQVSCGMEGTGISSPAVKLIISVLARVEMLTGHFIGTDVGERESTHGTRRAQAPYSNFGFKTGGF